MYTKAFFFSDSSKDGAQVELVGRKSTFLKKNEYKYLTDSTSIHSAFRLCLLSLVS